MINTIEHEELLEHINHFSISEETFTSGYFKYDDNIKQSLFKHYFNYNYNLSQFQGNSDDILNERFECKKYFTPDEKQRISQFEMEDVPILQILKQFLTVILKGINAIFNVIDENKITLLYIAF